MTGEERPAPAWTPADRTPIWDNGRWVVPIRFGLELDIAIELKLTVEPSRYSTSVVAGRMLLEDFKHVATMIELVDEADRNNYKWCVQYEHLAATAARGTDPWI